jgi:predicted GNAT family acetyltransferase
MLYPLSYGGLGAVKRAGPTAQRLSGDLAGTPARPESSYRTETNRFPGVTVLGRTSSSGNDAGDDGRWSTMETTVVDVPERGRFEIRQGERVVGLASYHVENGQMTLPHTEVDPSMGGQGIGTRLVDGVLTAARERGLTVLPYCSFVRRHILQHPEFLDLVAVDDRPHFGLETVDR